MKRMIFFLLFLPAFISLHAQDLTQNIRGSIVDKESKTPLVGATVLLLSDTSKITAAAADINGNFRLEGVKVGRHRLRISMIGYTDLFLSNIIVNSGKETVLNLELEEAVADLDEVIITTNKKDQAVNEMATVSTRTFSVEETERYAGSRSDPARMASNFAGVQGADDSRNDIVIRGNSPMGLLWRLEGVDIPNPNHFAVPGTTGGAISVLNNKVFGNSDFMTAAFPAEYGNANAGVFDIRMRNGNNEKHEFTGQFGFLGTELAGEGPISKTSGATYLATYRYSTLRLFEALNIAIGTNAVPNYQDASFRLNFPTKNKGSLAFFGVGGTSKINIMLSDKPAGEAEIYGDSNRDQKFGTSMGLAGITYSRSLNEKTFIKTTVAAYVSDAGADHDIFTRDSTGEVSSVYNKLWYRYTTTRGTANFALTKKFSAKHTIKTGIVADVYRYNMLDSNFVEWDTLPGDNVAQGYWDVRNDTIAVTYMVQPYIQWKYKPSDKLTISAGVHGLYSGINSNTWAVEPRAGLRYSLPKDQELSVGVGMHSQMQPAYIYFHKLTLDTATRAYTMHNNDLGLTRSLHAVAGYDKRIGANARMRVEVYYQHLYEVPVDISRSSFSLVNQGSTFSRFFPDTLDNTGTADNYGVEFTLEKFFSKTYFFLLTASAYESKYKGSDGVERDTDFNGNFATNLLIGKEFSVGKKTVLSTGAKITWAGGKRYSPVDTASTIAAGELVDVDSLRNSLQFRNYFRADLKLGIKINTKKLTHEIAIDLVNMFNTQNLLGYTYSGNPSDPIKEEYQLGFLPLFYYKVDF
jgi:hypothetical protein